MTDQGVEDENLQCAHATKTDHFLSCSHGSNTDSIITTFCEIDDNGSYDG